MTAETTAAKSIIVGKLAPNLRATAAAATPAKRWSITTELSEPKL